MLTVNGVMKALGDISSVMKGSLVVKEEVIFFKICNDDTCFIVRLRIVHNSIPNVPFLSQRVWQLKNKMKGKERQQCVFGTSRPEGIIFHT